MIPLINWGDNEYRYDVYEKYAIPQYLGAKLTPSYEAKDFEGVDAAGYAITLELNYDPDNHSIWFRSHLPGWYYGAPYYGR